MSDILERLARNAGGLTYSELIEDRVLAAQEIRRLRAELTSLRSQRTGRMTREPATSEADARELRRQADAAANPNRFVRVKELRQMLGVSGSTIWRWKQEGRFPAPIKLGQHATAWRLGDILAWQASLEGEG